MVLSWKSNRKPADGWKHPSPRLPSLSSQLPERIQAPLHQGSVNCMKSVGHIWLTTCLYNYAVIITQSPPLVYILSTEAFSLQGQIVVPELKSCSRNLVTGKAWNTYCLGLYRATLPTPALHDYIVVHSSSWCMYSHRFQSWSTFSSAKLCLWIDVYIYICLHQRPCIFN